MRLRLLTTATLAAGLLGGVNSAHGQCPHDAPCPPAARQVVMQALLLTVPADFCDNYFPDAKPGPGGARVLSARDYANLRHAMFREVAAGRLEVLSQPQVTVMEGQTGHIRVGQEVPFVTGLKAVRVNDQTALVPQTETTHVGHATAVRAGVSADGRFVRLAVESRRTSLGECELVPVTRFITPVFADGGQGQAVPFTQYLQVPRVACQTLTAETVVPVGGRLLVPGPVETREVREEFGVPLLSDIPYAGRLFKNVGIRTVRERTVLIVSPREVTAEPAAGPVPPARMPVGLLGAPVPAPAPAVLPAGWRTTPR